MRKLRGVSDRREAPTDLGQHLDEVRAEPLVDDPAVAVEPERQQQRRPDRPVGRLLDEEPATALGAFRSSSGVRGIHRRHRRRSGDTWSAPESITDVGPFARVDWHPTEDLIVFGDHDIGSENSTDEPTNLYTVRPDGSELTQITSFGPGEARAGQPTWTSDGRIVFTHVTGDEDQHREVAFVNADGSGLEIAVPAEEVGEFNRPHPRTRPV